MTSHVRSAFLALSVLVATQSMAATSQTQGAVARESMSANSGPYPCTFLFQLLAYTQMPDLRTFGIQPARVFGPQDFWPAGSSRDDVPDSSDVAHGLALRPPNGGPTVLDVEHWPLRGTDAEVAGTVDRLLGLLAKVRELEPDAHAGYYSIPPVRDYFRAIRGVGDPGYLEWQHENDRFQRLADAVNLLFPSLYTFYDDVEGWRRYAIENLSEARRLAGARPIYAFLWPQFHGSNAQLANQYLSGELWRAELEVVARYADGAVLWGGWGADGKRAAWDESAAWWVETKRFIEARNVDTCHASQ